MFCHPAGVLLYGSIATEDVASIDLGLDVVQTGVVPICYDGVAAGLELLEVIYDEAAEEGVAVLEGGLVDDDLGAFGLDALHHTLDGALTEVVTITLHR